MGWLSAVTALEQGPAAGFGMHVDHRRYRLVQAAHVYKRYRAGQGDREDVRRFEREMPPAERWLYRGADAALGLVHRVLPQRLKAAIATLAARRVGQLPSIDPKMVVGRYTDILEVCADRSQASNEPSGTAPADTAR